ncbi:hypothetical protein BDV12DRAFT_202537 [Aspergillus spectabilis]
MAKDGAGFLDSETVALQATKSGRRFHIHRDLLAHKSKAIASALGRGFKEAHDGVYTFQDTSEGTLARFIEWAYTGSYPAIIKSTRVNPHEPIKPEIINGARNEVPPESKLNRANGTILPIVDLTSENHPLLAHIRLYIFCSIYLIPNLQELIFPKITATCTDIDRPQPSTPNCFVFKETFMIFFGTVGISVHGWCSR